MYRGSGGAMKHYMDISEVHAEEIRDLSDNFREIGRASCRERV